MLGKNAENFAQSRHSASPALLGEGPELPSDYTLFRDLQTFFCFLFRFRNKTQTSKNRHQRRLHSRIAPTALGIYTRTSHLGAYLEFFSFDQGYFDRLRAGDPDTETHFASYFGELIRIKLRARYLPHHDIDDIRQETFVRVLGAIRKENAVQSPERLGAYVNSVCNNVLLEHRRSSLRHPPLPEEAVDIPDRVIDLDGTLISAETKESVRQVLTELPQNDRELIRAVLLEEGSKDQICRRLSVDRDYLRVLLHRAKKNFKSRYEAKFMKTRGVSTR